MAASNVPKRNASHLTAVQAANPRVEFEFPNSDFSLFGELLTVQKKLASSDDLDDCLILLSDVHTATTEAIQVIGKLLAGQDKNVGAVLNEEVRQIGYLIHGLGHIAHSLEQEATNLPIKWERAKAGKSA